MNSEKKKKTSIFKKFNIIFGMLLILLLPIAYLNWIVSDRAEYREEAVQSVGVSWAGSQIIGPAMMKVYLPQDKKTPERELVLNNYNVDVNVLVEMRKKGIFTVPVYTADVDIKGDFKNPYGALNNVKSVLSFDVEDSKGFMQSPQFKLMDGDFVSNGDKEFVKTISVKQNNIPFEIKYKIRGINSIFAQPAGQNSEMKITSNWSNPAFEGDFLPAQRKVTKNGFSAQWSIPAIAYSSIKSPQLGVSFLMPVDNYRMTTRAVKYAFLFLSLTFLAYFIFEITSQKKNSIHQLQYLMMGAAMLIFYLLLVSMSEFIPFIIAYIIAAAMTIALIGSYTYYVITKRQNKKFAIFMSGLMSVLYMFLYGLLMLQDLSLIIGSLGLFIIIALVMYSTRNIEWYNEDGE